MKKITSKKIHKRLLSYGALTAAIAGISDINGQVMYTDVDPDETLAGTRFLLDLNGDATIDYEISNDGFFSGVTPGTTARVYTSQSNSILGINGGTFNYPFALSSGTVIDSAGTTWVVNSNYQTLNWQSCAYTNSQWCGGQVDKFLGLRFNIGGNTHYGWVRLDIPADASSITVKDYAYNATPNAPITTSTTLGIRNKSVSNVKVVALNKSIGLYNLPEKTNYTLYNVAGQKVLDGKINNSTYVVEANSVSSGVYIIEIVDSNTKATLRKKVVL